MNKWDSYFFDVCKVIAKNSKCLSRQIGAIIVRDKRIISEGYNGPPQGVPHCKERYKLDFALIDQIFDKKNADPYDTNKCPRQTLGFKSGEGLEWCIAGHAERNALISAAYNGIATKGAIMYMDCGVPCTPCLVEIINAGITEIIVNGLTYYDRQSQWICEHSDLKVRAYDFG